MTMDKSFSRYGLFLYLYGVMGFVLGTLLLVGPVQWINILGRSLGWPPGVDRMVMMVVIFGFVVGTGWLIWKVTRWVGIRDSTFSTLSSVTISTGLALTTVWVWLNPAWMLGGTTLVASRDNQQFVFGSYPTPRRIRELEDRGFTGVVSLLHPAVVPFEPQLIKRGENRLQSSPLKFVHAPLIPWVGDSGEASRRRLSDIDRLERGKVFDLGGSVFLTPYPTREEFMAFVFNGTVRHVVSLMDPDPSSETNGVRRERKLMNRYSLPFSLQHIPTRPEYDPGTPRRVADYVRELPRPVVVHGFLSDHNSPAAEAFVLAYRFEDLPPVPRGLFSYELERGAVRTFDVNRVTGPRPRRSWSGAAASNPEGRSLVPVWTGDGNGRGPNDESTSRSPGRV